MVRLIDYLRSQGLSSAQAKKKLSSGKIFFQGVPSSDPGRMVSPHDVEVRSNAPRHHPGRDPVVLFRDDHLIVVVKPSGMLSVPAPRRREQNLQAWIGQRFGRTLAVHRLDEPTSGVMMFARTARAQQAIKSLLEEHAVERRYLAIVYGRVPDKPRRMETTLIRNRGDGLRGSGPGGRRAVTHLQLKERLEWASLIEAQLETGRTHQVRIHLAELRHPVLGDHLYGRRAEHRMALHAYKLVFQHPIEAKEMSFVAPLPDDLAQLRRKLLRGAKV